MRLAPRPVYLAGREELLHELDFQLAAGSQPRIVVLAGLGGAGKTSVALEYAYRHLAEAGVVWQFGAGNTAVLAAGFAELAAQLGVRDLADSRDPVASVHAMLARSGEGWLLIFDNAPDMASVAGFLPPAGPGTVMITSQNPNWPGPVREVPVLDREVAAGFLVSRTQDPDQVAARGLARELGGLPLALEQAAAYITATGGSLAGYLALLAQRRRDLLSRGEPAGYGKTVATTWALALERLLESGPGAVGLLRLAACYAPGSIPLRLLLRPRPELAGEFGGDVRPVLVPLMDDVLAAADAVAALRRYSLVTPAAAGSVSVHRLVQDVTLGQMPDELLCQWRQAADVLIDAAIPQDASDPETWPEFSALQPHAEAALRPGAGGMVRIASYLEQIGSYSAAAGLLQEILVIREQEHSPEHPDALMVRGSLAHCAGVAGDPAGACDQLAALLPAYERVLGPEHPDTLGLRCDLARWAGDAGDPAGACDQLAALLPVLEQVLGAEHQDTLGSRLQLARYTERAGDAAGARDQLAALLSAWEPIAGPGHRDILMVRTHLARCTGEAGDAAGARDQFAALLPLSERTLGPEHPDTLGVSEYLAHWIGDTGDPAGARDQFAALLPVIERVLGPDHPQVLATRSYSAFWTGNAGNPAGARDQFTALVPASTRVHGPEHPFTLTTRLHLARCTGEAGDPAQARDQFAALVELNERMLGPDHPQTLITRASRARWTGEAGDPAQARDQFTALVPDLLKVLGPQHPQSLAGRANLARWTGEAGDPARARDQFVALLPVFERVLGPEHPDTVKVRDRCRPAS